MPSAAYLKRLFNVYAPFYQMVSRVFTHSRKKQIEAITKFLNQQNSDTKQVVLVGGGDGLDISFFKEDIAIVYLDSAKGMYSKAQHNFKHRANTHFILSDFNEYAVDNASQFDAICLHFCLSITAHPLLMIQNACKLLKTGGVLSVMDVQNTKKNRLSTMLNVITKPTMFNLFNEMERDLNAQRELCLVHQETLSESTLFKTYIYEKK